LQKIVKISNLNSMCASNGKDMALELIL